MNSEEFAALPINRQHQVWDGMDDNQQNILWASLSSTQRERFVASRDSYIQDVESIPVRNTGIPKELGNDLGPDTSGSVNALLPADLPPLIRGSSQMPVARPNHATEELLKEILKETKSMGNSVNQIRWQILGIACFLAYIVFFGINVGVR